MALLSYLFMVAITLSVTDSLTVNYSAYNRLQKKREWLIAMALAGSSAEGIIIP